MMEIDSKDARPDEEQALLEVEPEQLLRRRFLLKTNKSFPEARFDKQVYDTEEKIAQEAPLTCRWKVRMEYKDSAQRRAGRPQGQTLEHVSERDSHGIKQKNLGADKQRSSKWRGETILGGSSIFTGENESSEPGRIQKYSFADISAGAGGASRGAEMAGLDVVMATEPCPHACDSYDTNFPRTSRHKMDTKKLAETTKQYVVDILHISSSAFEDVDKDKKATKKRCTKILKMSRPRLVIMEQASAKASDNNVPFLNAILSSFTDAGYSVQWKIVNMVEYGLPQMRKRMIVIAAGPGEALPSWPTPTHSSNPTGDQQPFLTEEQAISGLTPELHSLHDPKSLRVIDRMARDADKPMEFVIGSNGPGRPHPDGKREFTLRELASLQGFPTYHEFKGSYQKQQICKAFPPSVAMAFYQHIRQHMEEVDGARSSGLEPFELPGAPGASDLPQTGNANEASRPLSRAALITRDEFDEAIPDAMETIQSVEHPVRSTSRQRIDTTAMPCSPRLTVSPETRRNAGPRSPASHTPSPVQQLPTPSTGGHFIAGQRAAALRRRRDRAEFEEELESDGDDDNDGPLTLETPSKRPRTSTGSVSSHTAPGSSDPEADPLEDASMSEDASLEDGCLDRDLSEVGWDLQSSPRRSESYDGEV